MKKLLILVLFMLGVLWTCAILFRPRHTNTAVQHNTQTQNTPASSSSTPPTALHDCLKKNNPKDPLGLSAETTEQAAQRQKCIEQYGSPNDPLNLRPSANAPR